jgi:hypothetical protein
VASKTRAKTTNTEAEDLDDVVEDVGVDDDAALDNVVPLREGTELAKPEPDAAREWTTAQKVGAGAGVVGGAGLLAFGLYKLGQRFGWWGTSAIVIDDSSEDSGGGSTPSKGDNESTPKRGGGGIRAVGNPPNLSGDREGYNTKRYPHPGAVRMAMTLLGYKVEYNAETLVPNNQPNPEVLKFQQAWNKVIRGLDSGKVKYPSPVDDPSKLQPFRGLLDEDGIPGKNTINALEIAFNNTLKNKMPWRILVDQA